MNIGVNRSVVLDDDVLFEPTSWHIKIDFINQFITNNNVLISVLGEKGTGKSTFARMLKDAVPSEFSSVIIAATPLFDPLHFIEQICLQLDLDAKSTFADVVNHLNEKKSKTLLIFDNAEELPETFMKDILNGLMQQEAQGYCHVCIVSDFSLVQMTSRLASETYHDMIHSIELQPLNETEVKNYVLSRIEAIGTQKPEITDESLKQFYQLTEGNILAINTQMVSFFASQAHTNASRFKRFTPYMAIVPVFALATTAAVYFVSSPSLDADELAEQMKTSIQSVALELPLTSEIPFYEVASIHQPLDVVALQKVDIQMANQADETEAGETVAVVDKVMPVSSPLKESVIPQTNHSAPQKIAKTSKPLKQLVSQAHQKKSEHKVDITGHFTIQLLATRDKAELNRLLKKYPSSDGFKIRRFDNHGVVWYVLTHGDFAVRNQAQAALKQLPNNLAQFKPWIRATGNLKQLG